MNGCVVPSQELSDGFCFDRCPQGWSGRGALCLRDCPVGFADLGMGCQPASRPRRVVKSYLQPCNSGQSDVQGDCYEPQKINVVTVNGIQTPQVVGCGCIRKYLIDRVQCPEGYEVYNNSCVEKCGPGFTSVKDNTGTITSPYCISECPLKVNSKTDRWTFLGGVCVKESRSRVSYQETSTLPSTQLDTRIRALRMNLGLPVTMASELANLPNGSTLLERYRAGIGILKNVQQNPDTNSWLNFFGNNWGSFLSNPSALIFGFVLIFGLFYILPALAPLFKGVASLLGSLFTGIGVAGKDVLETAGSVVQDVGTGVAKDVGATLSQAGANLQANQAAAPGLAAAKAATQATQALQQETAAAVAATQALQQQAAQQAAASMPTGGGYWY